MNSCEKCISFDRLPGPDVEVVGEELKEISTCPFFPEGIPEEILNGTRKCEFFIDD